MRIAFFGGSFDPPHIGHLAVARAAAEQCALDHVLLAPTGSQPLKPHGSTASFADRLAMTRLLCAEDSRFEASSLDAPHPDGSPNYTVDTLATLQKALSPGDMLFALAGADSFATLPQWHDPERLLELAHWIVLNRPGYDIERTIASVRESVPRGADFRITALATLDEPVSATALRSHLAHGESTDGLLTARIAEYIAQHHLYTAAASTR